MTPDTERSDRLTPVDSSYSFLTSVALPLYPSQGGYFGGLSANYPNVMDREYVQLESEPLDEPIAVPRRRRPCIRRSYLQALNITFVLGAVVATIGPPILATVFDIQIGVAQSAYPSVGLHRGDLIVIRDTKISQVNRGAVIEVHDLVGAVPDQQRLGSVVPSPESNRLQVVLLDEAGNVSATELTPKDSKMHVVIRYYPVLGSWLSLLVCNLVKFGVVLFVAIANLLFYISRWSKSNSRRRVKIQFFDAR